MKKQAGKSDYQKMLDKQTKFRNPLEESKRQAKALRDGDLKGLASAAILDPFENTKYLLGHN